MKAAHICRYLLGFMFVVFGLNGFLHFIPMPPQPPGLAAVYMKVLSESHYMAPVFLLQLISGALLLANRYVPMALTLLGPIIVNILMFHILMAPAGIAPGIVATLLWFVVFAHHRRAFGRIFGPEGD